VTPSAERPLAELLAALAERSAAPGAGSAAAWAGALSAALLEMVSSFADADGPARRAAILRAELVECGQAELRSYEPVLEAMRLDATDPSRDSRLAAALSEASEPPLAIARASAEVAEIASDVAGQSSAALRGEAAAAVFLAEAACRAAARLLEINLCDRRDDPRRAEATRLLERAAGARERA
jgi:formiminotetrahydrofolate cyclodeaminase